MLVRAEENDIIQKVPSKKITLRRDTYDRKAKRPRKSIKQGRTKGIS